MKILEPSAHAAPLTAGDDMPAPVFSIDDLCAMLAHYLEPEHVDQVRHAYMFGAEAHKGQQRISGEPYISHPLAVAHILAEMHLDYHSIMAALLHDVIEDTGIVKEHLTKEFGEEVADLVDGVSKLTQIKFQTKAEAQAENFRKMLLAMTRDIRVILVKLADRLHNMRTLGPMMPDKRRRIARETLDIYVPIAHRLGLNTLRLELEELGFATLYPMRYRVLAEAVRKARGNRKEVLQKITLAMESRLEQEGLTGHILGREKHLYSVYQKMRGKHVSFSEVFDVYAFRIIVEKVDTCYRVLGVVHGLYKPVPGKFKDYIAIPKSNGYQAIHTVLFGPYGVPIEVQIRTEDMNKVAESGIAAHWLYKAGDKSGGAHIRAREWLREVLEMQKNAGNSLEFVENVKIDLFPDEVYVFTPKGKIMQLVRGATGVDFAYAVHTDVGNSCVAIKIDRHLAPLSTALNNGQTVEVITAAGAQPNPAWLNFVITGKARANIRNYLKNLKSEEAIILGKRLLDKALAEVSLSIAALPEGRVMRLLQDLKVKDLDSLHEDIGLGNRMAALVAHRLIPVDDVANERGRTGIKNVLTRYVPAWLKGGERSASQPLLIKGTEGMVVAFAKCCHPIPGDQVLGFVSAGRGIVIHSEECKNVAEFRNRPEKWIDVQWAPEVTSEFPVEVRVDVVNQRGALATVAAAIAEMGANIDNLQFEERDGKYSTLTIVVEVRDRVHLAKIMRRIRSLDIVARINRTKG